MHFLIRHQTGGNGQRYRSSVEIELVFTGYQGGVATVVAWL